MGAVWDASTPMLRIRGYAVWDAYTPTPQRERARKSVLLRGGRCREAEYAPWGTGKTRPPTHNRIGPRRRAYIRFGIPDIGIEYAVLF